MKERVKQLSAFIQHATPRERMLFTLGATVLCCAFIYYGVMMPLDNIIKSSQSTLYKQKQTLNWMLDTINKNNLQASVLTTSNPRSVVEKSASMINLPLTDIRQQEQSMSFRIDRVDIHELKNWLRQMNVASGIHLEKLELTPVDHRSEVKAQITLSWAVTA